MAGMIFCIAFFLAAFPFLERREPYMRVRFAEQFLVIIEFQTYPGGGSGSESTESNSWSLDWRPSTALRAGLRGKDG
jgi:chitinase